MLYSDAGSNDGIRQILADHERRINALYTARSAQATTISDGDFTVDGGSIIVLGGRIYAAYPSGRPAAFFGPLFYESDGRPGGHGLHVQADDDSQGRDVFRAKYENGKRYIIFGQTPEADASGAVDVFTSDAVRTGIHTHGDELRLQSHHGGDIAIIGGESTTGPSRILIWTPSGGDIDVIADDGGHVSITADGDFDVDAAGHAFIVGTGQAALGGGAGTFLQPQSGSGTANVRMDTTTGQITWVASTERVKHDIQDLAVDPAAVLGLRPRTWLPGQTARQCPEWMHAQHPDGECHAGEPVDPPPDAPREVGFVAEEIDALGLVEFVEYDADGLPTSVRYDRLTAALVPVVQQQQEQITALTEQLAALSDRVAALEPAPPAG